VSYCDVVGGDEGRPIRVFTEECGKSAASTAATLIIVSQNTSIEVDGASTLRNRYGTAVVAIGIRVTTWVIASSFASLLGVSSSVKSYIHSCVATCSEKHILRCKNIR
jgi:hypothetical protein